MTPCACNRSAPFKEPPARGRRPEEDEWTQNDPWTRAPRRGDDGDDGDDGDGGDDDYFIGTPGGRGGGRGPRRAHEYESGKLFEAFDEIIRWTFFDYVAIFSVRHTDLNVACDRGRDSLT